MGNSCGGSHPNHTESGEDTHRANNENLPSIQDRRKFQTLLTQRLSESRVEV